MPDWGNVESIRAWIRQREEEEEQEKQERASRPVQGPRQMQGPQTREQYEREMQALRSQAEQAKGWRAPVRAYDRPDIQQALQQGGGRSAELLRLLSMTGEDRQPQQRTADVLRGRYEEERRPTPSSPYQFQMEEAGLRTGDPIPAYRQWQMQRASGQLPDPNGGMVARPNVPTYAQYEAGRQADQATMQRQAAMLPADQRFGGWDVGNAVIDALGPAGTYFEERRDQRTQENEERIRQGTQSWYDPIRAVGGNVMDAASVVPDLRIRTLPAGNMFDLQRAMDAEAEGLPRPETNEPMTVAQNMAPIGGALNRLLNPFTPTHFSNTLLTPDSTPKQRLAALPQMFTQASDYIWSEWQKHNAMNQALVDVPDEQRREAELALLNATSGGDRAWDTWNAIQQKQNTQTLYETAKQLAAQGDTNTASQMYQTARDLDAKSYADIVDENMNIWSEIVSGIMLDPMSVVLDPIVDASMVAWRSSRAASRVAKAAQADLRTLDKAVAEGIELAGQLEQGITAPKAKTWLHWLFGRTEQTKAHMEADALWKSATQLFRGVDNAADAKLLLQTWIDDPAQLIRGVEGIQSPGLRSAAGVMDGKVRYGYLTLAGDDQLKALPILQSLKPKLLDLPALNAQGGFNALEFLTQLDTAIYNGVRQKYGLMALEDMGEGVAKWAVRRLEAPGDNGERWVLDYLDKSGGVLRSSEAMSYLDAKGMSKQLGEALKAGASTPTVQQGLKFIGTVQRGFLSDMWLNLRPSHWLRNAATATAAMMADDVYTLKATSTILDELGAKFVGSGPTRRLGETLTGTGGKMLGQAGQTATPEQRHWSRAIWDKHNPYAALNEAASQVWGGMTHVFGTDIPFGEQAFYLRSFEKGFGRTFSKVWADTVHNTLDQQMVQLGVDPKLAQSITDKVISAGVYGSKQDVAKAAREAVYGAFASFDPRTLGIPDELLSAQGWKAIQNGIEEWLQSSPTPGSTTMDQMIGQVQRIFGEEKMRYGNILRHGAPQPGVYEWTKLDVVDDAAEMMDTLTEAAKRAGMDPAQATQQAQQLATRMIDGQQQALDNFIQEVATANNPEAMNVAFDLLTQLHTLKTGARRDVDQFSRLAADAGTTEMWAQKWEQTSRIYTQLTGDLEATILSAADDLRTVIAGGDVGRKYDWWTALRRYFDYDQAKVAELRLTPLGGSQDDRQLWEAAIDANRQYLDASMVQLYDAFRRYPSIDALDVLRQTQKQIDIEGARVAAWLGGLREEALQGALKWDDYFGARNSAWYRAFDNMAIYNEAAKRAIVAEGLAGEVPTQLRWVDEFSGGEFFLVGPSGKEGRWLARRIDDGTMHEFDTPGRYAQSAMPLVPENVLDDWRVVTQQTDRMKPVLEEIDKANPLPARRPTGDLTLDTVPEGGDPFVDYGRPPTEPTAPMPEPSGPPTRPLPGTGAEPGIPTRGGAGLEQGDLRGYRPTPPSPIAEAAQEIDPNALLTKPATWQSTQRSQALVEGIQVRHKKTGELYTVQRRSESGGYYWVTDADGKTKRFKSNSIEAIRRPEAPQAAEPMPDIDQVWDEAQPMKYDATTPRLPETGGPSFLTDDPQETMQNIYDLMRRFWGKRKQPEVGDVAVYMIQSLDDAANRIISALPDIAQRTPNTLDAGQKRFLLQSLDGLLPAFDNAVSESRRVGEGLANAAMLNYQDRRGFDTALSLVFPYHYYWTRGGWSWVRRLATQPATLNLVYEANRAIANENVQSDVPMRLEGSIPLVKDAQGNQIRMGNPLNWLLPNPISDFVDPEAANNDLERWILRFQQVTPGLMPMMQYAMDSYFDAVSPLPDGKKRVETALRRYVPMYGLAGDVTQALTGERLPMSGDAWDPYRTRRAGSFMAQEGEIDAEMAQYAQQISWNLENGRDRLDGIPQPKQADAEAAYTAAQQYAGRESTMRAGSGLFAGTPAYLYSGAEGELREAQQQYGQAGYDVQANPYGSAAQRREVLEQNQGLPSYWSRNVAPGELEPAQAAQREEMWGQLDSQVYGPMADAVTRAILDNPDITEKELNAIKSGYYDKSEEIRARYPAAPESDPKPPSGANPQERAVFELERLLTVPGKPTYPGENATDAQKKQYYAERARWEEVRLNTIDQRLNQLVQQVEMDPTNEWQRELARMVQGRYSSDLLRQIKELKYATDVERNWAEREALRQETTAANWNSKKGAVEERVGAEGVAAWQQYHDAPKGEQRDAVKEQNPLVREVLMAGYNPNEYDQAITLFGPQAWSSYYDPARPKYPEGGDEATVQQYYDELRAWNVANSTDAEMRMWVNGRPTTGDFTYDFGDDWAEARRIFGEDIFEVERAANAAPNWAAWRNANPDAYMRYTGYREWRKVPIDGREPVETPDAVYDATGARPLGTERRPVGAADWDAGLTQPPPLPPTDAAQMPLPQTTLTQPTAQPPMQTGQVSAAAPTGELPTTAEGWAMRNASYAKGAEWQVRKQQVYEVFGAETGSLYDQYLSLPSNSQQRKDFKAQHPELRAVQLFTFQPDAYQQVEQLFGQDGVMAWARTPAYQDTPEAKAARAEYLDQNPKAFTVGAWLYGRPGQDNEDTADDEKFRYNLGADYQEASEKFGQNIWAVVEGYKRNWPKAVKSEYYKANPNLSPFFDWWYGNLPKQTGVAAVTRSGYSYGGGGGWGGGGGYSKYKKPVYMPRIDPRWMDRELEVGEQAIRRWRPAQNQTDLSWLRAGDRLAPERLRAWRPS